MTRHNHDKFAGISFPIIFSIGVIWGALDLNMWFSIVCFALAVLSFGLFVYGVWRHTDDVDAS
jgi:hypothetical protein